MKMSSVKIPIETRDELLEQYDYSTEETIFEKETQYAIAIGQFMIAFSSLESALISLIIESVHSRTHQPGYQVVKYLQFRSRISYAKDQYSQMVGWIDNKAKKDRYTADLRDIISKLIEINDFRNKVAHANWMTLDKERYVRVKIEADNGEIIFRRVKMTPTLMGKFSRLCYSLRRRIDSFQEGVIQSLG